MKNKVFKLSLISTLGLAIVLGCSKNSWFNSKEESNVEVRELSDNTENVYASLADGRYGSDLGFSPKTHMTGGSVGGGHASGSTIGNIIGGAAAGALIGLGAGIGAAIGSGSSTGDGTLHYSGTGTWVGSSTGSQTTPTTSPGETGTGTPIAQPVEGTLPQPELEKFTTTFQPVELPDDIFIPFNPSLIEVEPKDEWITGSTTYVGTLGGSLDAIIAKESSDDDLEDVPYSEEEKQKRLKNIGKTEEDLIKCLIQLFGIGTLADFVDEQTSGKGTMYLGRWVDAPELIGFDFADYHTATINNVGSCFYGSKAAFEAFGALASIANWVAVHYAIIANWDFFLVTDPFPYIQKDFKATNVAFDKYGEKHTVGGYSYSRELKWIRKGGYNYFCNSNFTWETLTPKDPSKSFESYFAPANYRVRKG